MSNTICPQCGLKPIHPGFKHCGRTCAIAATAAPSLAPTPAPVRNSGFVQFNRTGPLPAGGAPSQLQTPWQNQGAINPFPTNSGSPQCAYPGCPKPPYDHRAMYCSNTHREQAVTDGHAIGCLLCRTFPKMLGFYCGKVCQDQAIAAAPMVLPLEAGDPKFADIVNQFDASWRHTNKPKPEVKYVYKINQSEVITFNYARYRDAVEARGNFIAQRRSPGNECRRWHGTRRTCTLGDDPDDAELCGSSSCPLCCIISTNFKRELINTSGRSFNRFGVGIYASATSSKSDDYCSNGTFSPYKAMLLTHVVVGKGIKLTQDSTTLTDAPSGYDSVLGETGGSLKYDEVVVYNNAAIQPAWLVVYGP
ncbi:hypothetical protein FRB94_004822 [Tulasnella sp. JGI-2019a]|nr:hypothetical protein FRB93_002975 [Tulasnella sp. JGI-2019a]KAG9001329.1 hypothetical protein FRB94_004822 [Tulasnella sp. JGI-2019a]KAG9030065.1 hypothetical protein FRB95_004599 [Tulasnella sp. JGI-2019a]